MHLKNQVSLGTSFAKRDTTCMEEVQSSYFHILVLHRLIDCDIGESY